MRIDTAMSCAVCMQAWGVGKREAGVLEASGVGYRTGHLNKPRWHSLFPGSPASSNKVSFVFMHPSSRVKEQRGNSIRFSREAKKPHWESRCEKTRTCLLSRENLGQEW